MYNKITNPPKQPHQPLPLTQTNRTYSFSEQQSQQSQIIQDDLIQFVEHVSMIESIHQMGVDVVSVMRINCSDVGTVEQVLREDGSLNRQVRERMVKYLRVVDVVTCGMDTTMYQEEGAIQSNSQHKDYATNTAHKQDRKQVQTTNIINKNLKTNNNTNAYTNHSPHSENDDIKLTVQVKVPISQPLFQPQKQKQINKNQTPKNKHNKSITHSQVSQSKHFHKIQLKSVKRVDKKSEPKVLSKGKQKQKSIQNKLTKQQVIKKQEKKKQMPKEVTASRRFTISQRQTKNTKTLSYHVDNMKSNSRLKVSHVRQQSLKKTINDNSKSPCQHHSPSVSPNRHKNQAHIVQTVKITNKQHEYPFDMLNNTNLVYETVQKSTDFLQMLKMMNQQ